MRPRPIRVSFRRLLAAAPVLCLLVASPAQAQQGDDAARERERIFEQVFGRTGPHEAPRKVDLPVLIGGEEVTQIPALLSPDEAATKLTADPLLEALRRFVVPEAVAKIEQAKSADGFLSPDALREAGIAAQIDPATLSLVLDVPIELRTTRSIDIMHRLPLAFAGPVTAPASLSSYLNLRSGTAYLSSSGAGAQAGLQPLNLAFESATNFRNYVLQGDMNYLESGGRRWQRGDVSVVHDVPDDAVRYQAGDLAYSVTAFQAFEPIGGITFARNFSLQPYRLIQPAGEQNFVLTAPSRAQVLVNGQVVQEMQLAPGRYNLRDFPFSQGVNNVQLNLTDNVGRTSTIAVPFFFNSNLLQPGLQDFSYSIGVPSTTSNGLRRYSTGEPTASAFHRMGITDSLTLGANFQGNHQQQMAGLDAATATVLGNFTLDVAGSQVGAVGKGSAASLQYNYYDATTLRESDRAFQATAAYHSILFAPLGTTAPQNTDKLDLSVGYTQALPLEFTGALSASYSLARTGHNPTGTDLSLRRLITPWVTGSLDVGRTSDATGHPTYSALFTFTFQFPESRQLATTSYDTHLNTSQLSWQYVPPFDVGYPSASVVASNSDTQRLVDATVGYNSPRFESSFTENETLPFKGAPSSSLSTLNFGTALLFADGHFGIGRPVSDSFVLVVPRSNLSGLAVGVDPVGRDFTAQVDALGPAAVTSLASYQSTTAQVVVPDLPPGYELGPDLFRIVPSYKSGTVVDVGSDAVVLLDGTLVEKDGSPVALLAGLAATAQGGSIEFFTNRNGRFRIEGLKPGDYKLRFPTRPEVELSVTIPPGTRGIYRIGTIDISSGKTTPPSKGAVPAPPAPGAEQPPSGAAPPVAPAAPPVPSPPAAAALSPAAVVPPPEVFATPRQSGALQPALVATLDEIEFAAGSARLDATAGERVAEAARLQRQQGGFMRVIGYARASPDGITAAGELGRFDLELDRATAVGLSLVRQGVPTAEIAVEAAPAFARSGDRDRVDVVLER